MSRKGASFFCTGDAPRPCPFLKSPYSLVKGSCHFVSPLCESAAKSPLSNKT